MTVLGSAKDPEALTLTFTAEFAAPVERVWQLWEDPRQLERWWGPPGFPATFLQHTLEPGSATHYFMRMPDGSESHGWWTITSVAAPTHLEIEDGFGDTPETKDDLPVSRMVVTLETTTLSDASPAPGTPGTRMTLVTHFETLEALETLSKMGMREGMTLALGQIDEILAS